MGLIIIYQEIMVVRGLIVWALLVLVVVIITQTVLIARTGKLIVLLVGGKGYSSVRIGTPCNTCSGDGVLNANNHEYQSTSRNTNDGKRGNCRNCR